MTVENKVENKVVDPSGLIDILIKRPSTNRKHFLAFVTNSAFKISNGALAVGNVIVIEVQTRLLFRV